MKNFEELLQEQLDKLPYTKHLDDGQYNDGQHAGFEFGARWFKGSIVEYEKSLTRMFDSDVRVGLALLEYIRKLN